MCFFFDILPPLHSFSFFFFNDTATTEIYTLSLHDALPISLLQRPNRHAYASLAAGSRRPTWPCWCVLPESNPGGVPGRSEEHTSELQSHLNLVCRLLLEKKKKKNMCTT